MDSDEAAKKIRKAAEEGNVSFAETDCIEAFDEKFVDEFLDEICDAPGAWISDLSSLSDFADFGEERKEDMEKRYAKIEKKYGVDVRGKNILVDVFRAIHGTNRTVQ